MSRSLKRLLSGSVVLVFALSLILGIIPQVEVNAEGGIKSWSENFEADEPVWNPITLVGGATFNSEVAERTDSVGGKYYKVFTSDPLEGKETALMGEQKATGVKIGKNPIVISFEVLLQSDSGNPDFRVGVTAKKSGSMVNSMLINFSRENSGDWRVCEIGSDETKRGNEQWLTREDGTKCYITEEEASDWHRVDLVYYPASDWRKAKVDYFLDCEKLKPTPANTTYEISDDGTIGDFTFAARSRTTDAYWGIDNIQICEYVQSEENVKFNTIESGQNKFYLNWDMPLTENINTSEVIIQKFTNAKAMVENDMPVEIDDAVISSNRYGMTVELPQAAFDFEQYRVIVPPTKDITGVETSYVFEYGVIPGEKDKDIQTTVVKEYTFDTAPTVTGNTQGSFAAPVMYDGDNRAKITATTSEVLARIIDPEISLNDLGLEYVDINFEANALWDVERTNQRWEFGLATKANRDNTMLYIRFFKDKVQVSNSTSLAAGTGTNVTESGFSYYSISDWNNIKLRYYPNIGSIAQFELFIKDSGGTYQPMLDGRKLAASPDAGNTLGTLKIGSVWAGTTYWDNITIEKAIDVNAALGSGITGIKFADGNGNLLSTAAGVPAGVNKIMIYTCNMEEPEVSLECGSTPIDFEDSFANNVYTLDFEDKVLVENQTYTLTVGSEEYTFLTGDGVCDVGSLRIETGEGAALESLPSAGTNAVAKFDVCNKTLEDEEFILIFAAYKGNSLEAVKVKEVYVNSGDFKTYSTDAINTTGDYDRLAAFLWDGDMNLKRALPMVSIDANGISSGADLSKTAEMVAVSVGDFDNEGIAKIRGTVESKEKGKPVTVIIFEPGKDTANLSSGDMDDVISFCDEFVTGENGNFEFNFSPMCPTSSELYAYFGTSGTPHKETIYFSSFAENQTALETLYTDAMSVQRNADKTFNESGTKKISDIKTYVNNNLLALDFKFLIYEGVNQDRVAELLTDYIQKVQVADNPFYNKDKAGARDVFRTIVLMQALQEDKVDSVGDYVDEIQMLSKEGQTLASWFKNATTGDVAEITQRLENAVYADAVKNEKTAIEVFEEKAVEMAVLTSIHNADGYGEVKNVLDQYSLFTGINVENLSVNKLTSLQGGNFADYKALNDEIDKPLPEPPGADGGSGGGGGSVSAVIKGEVGKPETPITAIDKEESGKFRDVQESDWFYTPIMKLTEKGIINGKEAGVFAPDDKITREEVVKLLVVMLNLNTGGAEDLYNDVNKSDWFYPYVSAATKKGIVNGIGDGSFGTGMPIIRQDMAVMLGNIAMQKGIEATEGKEAKEFNDNASISDYAKEAVEKLSKLSVISGYSDGTFAPQLFITRAEAAQMLYKFMEIAGL